ncbi:RsmD family RNA methyltransferase [Flaviaesturariibacter amylovorans]|uniref:16S rRNA (Guanine(966)-N(2))-methyltransferase RsmD n=1 Tax=Flaviaesturariibacter amylovorans TaxID=1084520 RepID=A0ABP8GXQ2_9BACT
MRIISGDLGGRRIHPPSDMPHTRPTTDIAKEGLFNILQNNLDFTALKTLDLFGGTGAISYELASRGAPDLTIVEKDPKMHAFIEKTVKELKIENIRIVRSEVFRYIETCGAAYDFIFAGPPYALATIDEIPRKIFQHGLLKPGGWFILEHTPRNDYKGFPHFRWERNYGTTVFTLFVNEAEAP